MINDTFIDMKNIVIETAIATKDIIGHLFTPQRSMPHDIRVVCVAAGTLGLVSAVATKVLYGQFYKDLAYMSAFSLMGGLTAIPIVVIPSYAVINYIIVLVSLTSLSGVFSEV